MTIQRRSRDPSKTGFLRCFVALPQGYSTVRGQNEGMTFKSGARMAGYRSGSTYEALGDRTYFWTATTRGADV